MILKHEIDNIFLGKGKEPVPESTPCWEWVIKMLKEKANELSDYSHFEINFQLYKDGRFTYTMEASSEYDSEEGFIPTYHESEFSVEEVMACEELAYYNWIGFSVTPQPEASECDKVIQFMY